MANYNKVLLMGNITRDIELKSIAGGQSVARIGIAVNRKWTGQDGQLREEVTFVDCDAWGKTAETMAKYLTKGRPVFIEGRLKLDQWEKDGQKHSKLKVVVESFNFIDSRPGGGGGGGGGNGGETESKPSWSKQEPKAAAASASSPEPMPADDIPF
ncbi:Single-stranded DNA-binding protein [Phycisphaerales bacterium]|nr:Single-stranded DNA-binding protein [Phycisphaerales bacterium]